MSDTVGNEKIRNILNYAALAILMVFYAGTWTFPGFYHVTEIYNSLIVFTALVILFFANVNIVEKIRKKEPMFIVLSTTLIIAVINLFIIGSNKGCILIIADFLMLLYLAPELKFTERQRTILKVFFLIMFVSWFIYDRAFSYNSNTGATVTVFTFFGGFILLQELAGKKEIFGFFLVIAFIRVITLVFWHLARGAFFALALFLLFYYILPKTWWKSAGFYRSLIVFSTLGSLAFVGIYVFLGSTGFNMKLPFFYKNIFSGREQIWYEVWEILKDQLLTGIGSGRELRSFFEYNIHNAMYDILAVHGVIVFAGSIAIIWNRLKMAGERLDTRDPGKMCAIAAIFAIFIESFIDMDLMWADYSPVLLILLVTVFDNKAVTGKNEENR
ncbi:MAG: hypothetical protein K6A90_11530 [Lachnospiraceae bacterium]|nr:hypothetical protein [Lachnospiraceae bacterium]